MSALGPGNIVTNLVVISGVVPRQPVYVVCRSRASAQLDGRNTVVNVFATEDPVKGEVGRSLVDTCRQYVNAVGIIVESNLIQQRWADGVGGVNCVAIRRIVESVEDA